MRQMSQRTIHSKAFMYFKIVSTYIWSIYIASRLYPIFCQFHNELDFCFEARDKTSCIHMIRIILFDICWSCLVLMIFSSLSPTDSWRNRNYEVRAVQFTFIFVIITPNNLNAHWTSLPLRRDLLSCWGCRWWSSPSATQRAHAECDD